MGVTIVAQQLLKAVEAVRLPVPGMGLVFPLFEWTPAVGADKALGVELVPHGRDNSALARIVADTTLVLGWGVICKE